MSRKNISELHRLAELGKLSGGFIHDLANHITVMSLSMNRVENFMNAIGKHLRGKDIRCYFSPEKKLSEIISLFKFKAEKNGVVLKLESKSTVDSTSGATISGTKNLRIYGSRLRFNQLFSNLISNAIDSFSNWPERPRRNKNVKICIEVKSDFATIYVSDNGCGIDPKIKEKIFEPFFTTKTEGKGMGLGLPTVKDIVERDFKGSISFKSAASKGTTFYVCIPLSSYSRRSKHTEFMQ